MKYLTLLLLLISSVCFADVRGGVNNPSMYIEEQDGSPSNVYWKLIFPDNTITDNGDNTASLNVATESHLTSNYVPYTGAISAVDLNSQSLTTTGTLSAGASTLSTVNFGSATGVSATATAGVLTFTSLSGSGENATIDGTLNNLWNCSSTSGAVWVFSSGLRMNSTLTMTDGQPIVIGGGSDTKLLWETTDNDSLKLGLVCNSATDSGYFSIMEAADTASANRSPLATTTHPTLRIYSEDATSATDYGEFYQDGTNFNIDLGEGSLRLPDYTEGTLCSSSTGVVTSKYESQSVIIQFPTAASDISIWRTPYAITIRAVHLLCIGNVVVGNLTEQDANGLNDAGVDGATDITGIAATNVDDDGTLSNPSIDAGDYVGWRTTSVTGTPTSAIITFEYTRN